MPQLELATFFSQFFWLVLIFLGFYLVVTKHHLPQIARTKKLRDKRLANRLSQSAFSTHPRAVSGAFADQTQHKMTSVTTRFWEGHKSEASQRFHTEKERYASRSCTLFAQILHGHKKGLHLILPLVTKPQFFGRFSKPYFFTYAISPYRRRGVGRRSMPIRVTPSNGDLGVQERGRMAVRNTRG